MLWEDSSVYGWRTWSAFISAPLSNNNWLFWNWQKEISQTKHIDSNTFIPSCNGQTLPLPAYGTTLYEFSRGFDIALSLYQHTKLIFSVSSKNEQAGVGQQPLIAIVWWLLIRTMESTSPFQYLGSLRVSPFQVTRIFFSRREQKSMSQYPSLSECKHWHKLPTPLVR